MSEGGGRLEEVRPPEERVNGLELMDDLPVEDQGRPCCQREKAPSGQTQQFGPIFCSESISDLFREDERVDGHSREKPIKPELRAESQSDEEHGQAKPRGSFRRPPFSEKEKGAHGKELHVAQ